MSKSLGKRIGIAICAVLAVIGGLCLLMLNGPSSPAHVVSRTPRAAGMPENWKPPANAPPRATAEPAPDTPVDVECPSPRDQANLSISGYVFSGVDRSPMGNVGVMAQPPGGYGWGSPTNLREVTVEAGYFEFVELSPGRYELLVAHHGFVRMELAVDLKKGESVTGVQFLLERGSRISGRVVDACEVAMEKVQIQLTKWPSRYDTVNSGSTGTDGSYSLTGLCPGKYILHVATRPKDGFPMSYRKEFTLALPDGEVSRSVDVRFPWAMKDAICRMSGTVTSEDRPVAGSTIELTKVKPWGHLEVKTDKEGRYITRQLLPGDYVVQVANCRVKLLVPEAETHRFDIEIPSSLIS